MEKNSRAGLIVGAVLIAAGVLALLGQVFDYFNWEDMWPLIIIGVGGLFFIGMFIGGKQVAGLAIPGSIICMIGLIMLGQSIFDAWETWSYAWALIVVAVGIGIMIAGLWSEDTAMRRNGWGVAKTGIILFVVFGSLFTLIFSLTGQSTWNQAIFFPVALIIVGIYLLVSRSIRLIRKEEGISNEDRDLFWPVMFIGIGALWICASQGWIPAPQVLALLSLWPVVLILIGINLLFGRRHAWVGAVMGVIVVVALFAYAMYGSALGLTQRTSSWLPFVDFDEFSMNFTRVDGSGQVSVEERPVSGFTSVSAGGIGDVEIIQGQSPSLTVEADDNLQQYILSEVRGGRLVIRTKNGITMYPRSPVKITITVMELNELDVSGAARVNMKALETNRLTGEVSGAGSLILDDLQADELDMDVSGAGRLVISGEVDTIKMELSGAGKFMGEDLQARTGNFEASGAGQAITWVTDQLEIDVSGAGIVKYFGNPEVDSSTSGGGRVEDMGMK